MARADGNKAKLRVLRGASSNHCVIHLDEAVTLGMSKWAVYRLVDSGEWRLLLPKVIGTGVPGDRRKQLLAAGCLWAGAGSAASHRSAGFLWDLDGVTAGKTTITTIHQRKSPRPWLTVHRTTRPFAIHRRHGVPVTAIDRTLVDLGSVATSDLVELGLEDALRRRLTTVDRLEFALRRDGGRGRRGAAALVGLLRERAAETRQR